MITNFLSYLLLGIIAGIMSGMFGIGGGIVIVPALILFYHFPPAMANGTSLAALLLPVGILAVIKYYRENLVQVKTALIIAAGIVGGVLIGSLSAIQIPSDLLKKIYGLFLLIVSNNFLEFSKILKKKQTPNFSPANENDSPTYPKNPVAAALIVGILAGILAGFFGIGGGIVIVPLLTTLFRFPYKLAIGTSLLALLFPVGLPGVAVYYHAGLLDVRAAIFIGFGLFLGAFNGALLTLKLPTKTVRRLYGIFLIIVGIDFIANNNF